MTSDELKSWQSRMGLTNVLAAKLLNETSLSTYEKWLSGTNRIPNILELALCEVERRLKATASTCSKDSGLQ